MADFFFDQNYLKYQLDNDARLNISDFAMHQLILTRIDRQLPLNSGELIVEGMSSESKKGLESFLKAMEKLILGVENSNPILDSNDYFNRSLAVYVKLGEIIEAGGGDKQNDGLGQVISLSHLSAADFENQAQQ